MSTCPHCDGERRVFAFWDGPNVSGSGYVDCSTCKGAGTVTPEHMQRIVDGRKRRDDRVARRVSLAEEARRLGIKPVELSAIERGRT